MKNFYDSFVKMRSVKCKSKEKKLFTFPSSPSSPQTSPAFKPKNGRVYIWGLNASGQLGNGFPTPIPTQVLNITNASSVWAGGTQSFSILKSGEVKGWGANGNTANLAIGETNTSKVYEPNKAVVGIENVIHFDCGPLIISPFSETEKSTVGVGISKVP
ncbi:Chromosome condensation regulator RCC1 repeat protein [Leptospira santarosai]|uniref:Chromosome condensation regulator RCC1 repeat protein n=1 Tax=Leptospira santarosai TaxID=28183 RepID=A0A2P1QV01_9LEPT|nr:Chromosome condensation regulator RCC1 repeat protein [Leptospira santarosai]